MKENRELLMAILANPEDDAVRLVYADWLEDKNGEGDAARAEFVRVQLELARLEADSERTRLWIRPKLHFRKRNALRRREREFVRGSLWRLLRDELPPDLWREFDRWRVVEGDGLTIQSKRDEDLLLTFRRGLVHTITLTAAAFLAHAGAVFAAQPVVEVALTDREPSDDDVEENEDGGERVFWFIQDEQVATVYPLADSAWHVPSDLGPFLRADQRCIREETWMAMFASRADALAALSAAAVSYGRTLAGLPVMAPA